MENVNIKKTMKFTRLNELVTENNELIDETKRLKMHILEARSYTDQFNTDYSNRIDNLKR
jgi:Fe-S-cluster formation regulator IscX/YfhJ